MPERQYRIHPAIGVARVGDAPRGDATTDFFFIWPEFRDIAANIDPTTGAQGQFKTSSGHIKAQAVRFRIFEYEKGADGKFHPIGEVMTSDGTRAVAITWTVHLANRKASFCAFGGQAGALDTPLFASFGTPNNPTARNKNVKTKAEREKWLELDPGARQIKGGDVATVAQFSIDHSLKTAKPGGETKLKIRTLGELRSDTAGRLIVIGGMGQSDFDPGLGREPIGHFANNDGWFDDISDGPVEAQLTIDGVQKTVDAAWVLVAPPDFAPPVRSHRTMYDTLVDIIVREMTIPVEDGLFTGPLAHIAAMNDDWKRNNTIKDFKPSFTRDIAPFLSAIVRAERVFQHQMGPVARYHGTMNVLNFAILGGPGSLKANRQSVFERLRDPNTFDVGPPRPKLEPAYMPSAYGDYYGKANGRGDRDDPAFLHAISKLQYALLRAWVNGDFLADWEQVPANPPAVTPEGLDHAALDNMSGGAFFPGMEASWLFAHEVVWRSPFRVARGKNVGSVPVPDDARHDLLLEAGAFSQQMAVPWQADFLDCSSLTSDDGSEYGGWVKDDTAGGKRRRVAWWPANRPNDVFPIGAPRSRRPWARVPDARGTGGYHEVQDHNEMVAIWSTLGFIVEASPDGEQRDLFEVEFNTAPPLVAEAVVPSAQDAKRGRPRKTSGRKRKPKVRITV